MKEIPWKRYVVHFGIFAFFLALDLWTKALIMQEFRLGQSKTVVPGFFSIVRAHNTGAAFSMGDHFPNWVFVSISFIALGVLLYLFVKLTEEEKLSRFGLALVLSGAVGNLVDRIRLEYVVDFLLVYVKVKDKTYSWPAFNVADSAITVGAILFGIEILRTQKKAAHNPV